LTAHNAFAKQPGSMAGDPNSTEVLALEGEIDLHRSPQLKQELSAIIDRQPGCILVDLSRVSYMDSSGLAVFVEALQRLSGSGGKFGLFGLGQSVRHIFEIARLDQVFRIFPDESAARAALA
jgi:anti-sigma B factor antagonist